MAGILRGEIRWADLNPVVGNEQRGKRPVLIISHDVFNKRTGTSIALAITSKKPPMGYPLAMGITSCRLPKESWVKIGQVRTLSCLRIGRKLGTISPEELADVLEGLYEIVS